MKSSPRRAAWVALVAFSTSLGGVALATRSGSDRDRANAAITALSAIPEHARLAHEPLTAAKHALGRADDARATGDQKLAPELDALAREHAETGTDLVRAAEAEKKLRAVQKDLTEVETKLSRARALLEEAIARRGRAQAKLDELEKAKQAAPAPTPAAKPGPKLGAPKPGKAGGKAR